MHHTKQSDICFKHSLPVFVYIPASWCVHSVNRLARFEETYTSKRDPVSHSYTHHKNLTCPSSIVIPSFSPMRKMSIRRVEAAIFIRSHRLIVKPSMIFTTQILWMRMLMVAYIYLRFVCWYSEVGSRRICLTQAVCGRSQVVLRYLMGESESRRMRMCAVVTLRHFCRDLASRHFIVRRHREAF